MSNKLDRPDSARSWAIAAAAFVISIMLSGVSRTTGLFYVALIDTYGVSRMKANMPFTLRNIVRNLLGPVVGAIGHRYGAREVTMAGGAFAATGVALCAVAPDVVWISAFWGGMHGIGVAFGNTLFQVILSQYFVKHRATASGIAFSGGCVGSFTFPVILEYMLIHIGLPGTFLLTGAVILHVLPAGMLMKEPQWMKKAHLITNISSNSSKYDEAVLKEASLTREKSHERNKNIFAISFKNIPSNHDICSKVLNNAAPDKEDHSKKGIDNYTFTKKDLEGTIQKNEYKAPNTTTTEKPEVLSIYQGIIHMCCDPMFHMISLSLAAFVTLFDLSLTVIVDYLVDKGLQEGSGMYFISLISVADFVGRLGFGWVTDKNYLSPYKYMFLLHAIQGLSFAAMPFLYSYDTLMAAVVVCGAAGGANVVMYPILVAKYLPSVQSLAVGSISFLSGFVAFGVPFMIGYFRDTYGSYDGLYFIIGGLSSITGVIWLLEPLLIKLKRKIIEMRKK